MNFLRLFIDRPVFATVVNILVIMIGLVALTKLTVREYPNIDVPAVSVVTKYTGASAYIIESQLTDVLEESLSGIDGVDYISSKSSLGKSEISVQFIMSRDADAAASDVRDRVARVRNLLPDDIDEPVIAKVAADATPFIYLALTSSIRSSVEVNDYAENQIKDVLQTIPGIAEIRILGGRRHAMRVWLQKDKMASLKITPQDVEKAIRSQNLELPAGLIESTDREFSVYPKTNLYTPEDFENIIIRVENGSQVLIRDIAKVEMGIENKRSYVRYNGATATGIGIIKQATANPIYVAREIHERLDKLKETLPEDMSIAAPHDSSLFIEASINAVWSTLVEALFLVLLVIFVFLQSGRATLVPVSAIPVSLIGAFIFMWVLGFSINTLTLLSLVLAIGIVVDDAIVMLENIYRHLEKGKTPLDAAIDGSKEMVFPVMAMTLTLAAVFAPVAFVEGRTGKLFVEFALTLTGAVLVSGFVALTWSPMLCSRFLKIRQEEQKKKSGFLDKFESLLIAGRNRYLGFLKWLINHRWIGWTTLVACLLLNLSLIPANIIPPLLYKPLADELSPVEDKSFFFTIAIAPEGSTPEYVSEAMRGKEKIYEDFPEISGYFTVAGYPSATQGVSFVPLKPYKERDKSSEEMAAEIMGRFFMLPEIFAFAMPPQSLGASSSAPVSVMIQSNKSYPEILKIGNQLATKIRENPGMNQVRLDLRLNNPEIEINIDRQKAADIGIGIDEISQTLETFLGGKTVTNFKKENKQYLVLLQMDESQRSSPQDINDIYLRTPTGEMVAISNFVTLTQTTTAEALPHFDKIRATPLSSGLSSNYSVGDAVKFLKKELYKIDPEAKLAYMDNTREYMESGNAMIFAMLMALIFIYLVLSAQFESFLDPFIIMTSVLPAFIGALIALKLTGGSLNIYSKIGLITLIGLITKHGILMVEFANHAVMAGKNKVDAILEAAETRYRPILMTAAATVLGAFPLAFATGAGSETRHEIGWVIVGGLSLGTILTLIIVPVAYIGISRKKPPLVTAQ